ncbi:MAG: AraC family transcriptional regulator [Oscillospiraceae bacterium]|nr:AraC family transcriptional regulator [Oscillospiraceae bacterium]
MESNKHQFKSTTLENLSLAVYNTGYQKCDSSHTWGPATRDHYLIHYIASGKGVFNSQNRLYSLCSGEMFLIFPGQIASYSADSTDPWEYYWVGFNGTEAHRLVNLSGFTKETPVLKLPQIDEIKPLLLNIYQKSGFSPASEAEMTGNLYIFLSKLMRVQSEKRLSYDIRDYLAQALRFIQHNFADSISVSDIASFVGISRSQLYRAFIEFFNISPNEYLQKYRLNEACSLLHDGSLSISAVASSVGYADPLYFSRVFKKRKGLTPTEYRLNSLSL